MNYNFIGLFLIFTNFFCNIITIPQEYYITSILGQNIFASQMNMFHICFYSITQMGTLIDYLSAKSNHNRFISLEAFTYQNMLFVRI